MHTSLLSFVPADESPSREAFSFRVRATSKWQEDTRLHDFVEVVEEEGHERVSAQVLLFFTARYTDPNDPLVRREMTGAFIRDLLRWTPEIKNDPEDLELKKETHATLLTERECVLKYKTKYGYRVVPLDKIKSCCSR